LFADAKVTVDVVFLIKERRSEEWLHFDKLLLDGEQTYINRYFSENPSHVLGDLGIVEAYGRPEMTCRQSKEQDTIALLRQQLAHFPPQQLPTVDTCKKLLTQRIALMDKQILSLTKMKGQLMRTQRDLQLMERNFMQQCADKVNLDISIN
jgi:N12 class adenine-specific DNA methylase